MPRPNSILKEEYRGNLVNDCSGYFRKIAERLQVKLPPGNANADQLIKYIAVNWIKIGKGPGGGPAAQSAAKQGYLVVAVLHSKDTLPFARNKQTGKWDIPHPYSSGHIAIVLPTAPSADYPYVICGSTIPEGRSDGSKKLYEKGKGSPWKEPDAPNVAYYRTPDVVLIPFDQNQVSPTRQSDLKKI
jgi:hypothetical protein